jgi:phosphonate degradation associated HDIG domain protein
MTDVLDELEALFTSEGAQAYLGEEVSIAVHMLQAADRAAEAGGSPAVVVAALLHDIGHFTGLRTGEELMSGTDNRHDEQAAEYLSRFFGPDVTEPVRLHVAAKRYLCAVEPSYFGELSPASVYTLSVQGGPMSPAEAEAFAAGPYAADAVLLRRCDDAAKDPDRPTPPFADFRAMVLSVLDDFSHQDSITVDASPAAVYDVVSDVTRTGEWSPICARCEWDDGDGPRVGAHFTGHNVKPDRTWSTRSEVVAAEPGRAFAWEVAGGLVRWGYELAPEGSGTRLTETWEFRPVGRTFFHEKYGADAEAEIATRIADARSGIPATLAAIKRVVEQ